MFHDLDNLKFVNTLVLGYKIVYMPKHPYSNKSGGWVYYHRLVMEDFLGRFLEPHEIVHHLDEDKENNSILNLELLTKAEHTRSHKDDSEVKICIMCNLEFKNRHTRKESLFCSQKCFKLSCEKIIWPTNDELKKLVWKYPTIKVGEILGVSGKSVEKRCKNNGIEKPPRGYWQKKAAGKL